MRVLYRLVGVDPGAEQRWGVYLRSVPAFSVVSILVLCGMQGVQDRLWLSLGMPAVSPDLARNTAASL
ncbi:potassium-transporting ATPase subunit KdpA [Nonomuraea sp. NPDC049784]|uniref:potassium-transporting ATPase subunit KdpA n=1 Tax=Nonomuraea sp. NPDC049784 TaxID=3154361 RepID=UPI0033DD760D